MKEEKTEKKEKKEERFYVPALAYSHRAKERETREKELFMSAIYTANRHNAMACYGD